MLHNQKLSFFDKYGVCWRVETGVYGLAPAENETAWILKNGQLHRTIISPIVQKAPFPDTLQLLDYTDFAGVHYIATHQGVWYLRLGKVYQMNGLKGTCYDLLVADSRLLAACDSGLYEFHTTHAKQLDSVPYYQLINHDLEIVGLTSNSCIFLQLPNSQLTKLKQLAIPFSGRNSKLISSNGSLYVQSGENIKKLSTHGWENAQPIQLATSIPINEFSITVPNFLVNQKPTMVIGDETEAWAVYPNQLVQYQLHESLAKRKQFSWKTNQSIETSQWIETFPAKIICQFPLEPGETSYIRFFDGSSLIGEVQQGQVASIPEFSGKLIAQVYTKQQGNTSSL
ncbi:MAG: hypothetical protein NZ108_11140, partial [Bacteroidia bacterium]|nr:hypothetical protein [Bacteroidia bacterium]